MKKKYKRAGTTSERQDYRKGGQVSKDGPRQKFYPGGIGDGDIGLSTFEGNFNQAIAEDRIEEFLAENPGFGITPPPPAASPQVTQTQPVQANIMATAEQKKELDRASEIAQGRVGNLPTPKVTSIPLEGGSAPIVTIDKQAPVSTTQITTPQQETVTTTASPTTVAQPEAITPATVEAAQVEAPPTLTAAQTQVDETKLATTDKIEKPADITPATVEIKEGALTQNVIGTLSSEAKSQAAQVAGLDLGKVTRAKKQLKTAGVSDSTITSLGNDPEALENALMNIPESERGVIEGLPQEALVSNQINTLLAGIEQGQIPTWAKPAVAAVEQILASRGLEASTVGRDALVNTIIQNAMPIAQSNAQAIQAAVAQERSIEAQVAIKEAEFQQQSAIQNAQNVFQLDLAQFSADQQTALSNSKFLQTVSITEANAQQQATIQQATLTAQANVADASVQGRLAIENAKAFLQTDLANLSAEQQVNILAAQQDQQRMLSNQAALNTARQINAASENQLNQFSANLANEINKFNAQTKLAAEQFNASSLNAAEARRLANDTQLAQANAQLKSQIEEFNAQLEFNRSQFNASNTQAILQSNTQWRRQVNLTNTATQNAVNQQNAQNAFNLTTQANAFIWQTLRDQADFDFRAVQNERNRESQIIATALSADPKSFASSKADLQSLARSLGGSVYIA
jgi:hypothetical protein|tara:strand:- start:484 stop:2550 length:2067 start_codon:yes stop_codon:yes gene_type:complete